MSSNSAALFGEIGVVLNQTIIIPKLGLDDLYYFTNEYIG